MRIHHRIPVGIAIGLMGLFVACTSSPNVQIPLERDVPEAYVGADQSWVAPLDRNADAVVRTASIQIGGSPTFAYGLVGFEPDSAQNGWGPYEKNTSNGESQPGDGRTMTINGVKASTGLGVHAPSSLEYPVAKQCSTLQATIGLDDEIDTQTRYGSVVFQVFGDGNKLYDSGVMRGNTPSKDISVNIKNVQRLKLVVTDAGDNKFFDHADWTQALLVCPNSGVFGEGAIKSGINFLSEIATFRYDFSNGYGPIESNMSNGEQFAQDGKTITLNGQRYARGLGVHTPSRLGYGTNQKCTRFKADIGLDDEVDNTPFAPTVEFTVTAFNSETSGVVYKSGPMTRNDKKSIDINITGKTGISIAVNALNTENNPKANWYAHADWANAQLICN